MEASSERQSALRLQCVCCREPTESARGFHFVASSQGVELSDSRPGSEVEDVGCQGGEGGVARRGGSADKEPDFESLQRQLSSPFTRRQTERHAASLRRLVRFYRGEGVLYRHLSGLCRVVPLAAQIAQTEDEVARAFLEVCRLLEKPFRPLASSDKRTHSSHALRLLALLAKALSESLNFCKFQFLSRGSASNPPEPSASQETPSQSSLLKDTLKDALKDAPRDTPKNTATDTQTEGPAEASERKGIFDTCRNSDETAKRIGLFTELRLSLGTVIKSLAERIEADG